MSSKSFKLTLNIAKSVLATLNNKEMALLAFRGYQGTNGFPTIWYTNKKPVEKLCLEWNSDHKGFISDTPLTAGNEIVVKKGFDMKAGQSADLDYEGQGNMSFFEPLESDDKSTYYMLNSSIVNVKAVGLMSKNPDGQHTPCCACSFLSNSMVEMKPLPSSIFLTFASAKYKQGELMENSPTDGVLVKFTSDNATLSHDGQRWEVSGAILTQHTANSDLRKILAGK